MKSGTTGAAAHKSMSKSHSVRRGPSNKNISHGANRKPTPTGPTGPIKGMDRGGV